MTALLPILAALLAGVGIALQPPTNAILGRASGSVVLAALVSFAVGTAILFVIWAGGARAPLSSLKGVPAYAWAGGAYGAYFVSAGAFAAPRLGLAVMLTIMIASQLATGLLVDRLGLLDLPRVAVTWPRLAGVALVFAGALLVRRG